MNICIFGDSITWGASDSEKGGWVERLKIYLGEKYDANTYNLGVSGDNTDDLIARMKHECEAREPNIIVVAIGINDSQYIQSEDRRRITAGKFRENLAKLYEIAKQFTVKIVFVGLTQVDESKTKPISWDTDKQYDNDGVKQYDTMIQEFCAEKDVRFIEMTSVVKHEDLEDGLHPNSKGHAKMFERIKVEIEKNLAA